MNILLKNYSVSLYHKLSIKAVKMFFLVLFFVFTEEAHSQNTAGEVKVNVVGLSKEYTSKFKDEANIKAFKDALYNVEYDISPIVISVTYKNGQGFINVTVENYSSLKHFNIGKYKGLNEQMRGWGIDGISIRLQEEVLTAIAMYKRAVASDGFFIDKDIDKFTNVVTLKKTNGDSAIFSGYIYRLSNGISQLAFYSNVELLIDGRYMTVVTDNSQALNNYSFFAWGKTMGVDGKKTSAYFMSEFFKPTKQEQEILEAKKKPNRRHEKH